MRNFKLKILFSFIFLGLTASAFFACLPAGIVSASMIRGTIDGTYRYAWGDKSGWLNFGLPQALVTVRDYVLTGYVWSENFGWINLSPSTSGVANNSEGVLSGYAWGDNAGWINFSGVIINSSGQFTGTAFGDITGTINFNSLACPNCKVVTDWRPKSIRPSGMPTPGEPSSPPTTPFNVLINNGQAYTKYSVVTLQLQAGSDTARMAISESPNFENTSQEYFLPTKTWILSQGDGQKTIYVKFYTQYGQSSQTVSSSIILDRQPPEIKITSIKNQYSFGEDVIVGGNTEANATISFYLDQNYGSFQADSSGQWTITLGKLAPGNHNLELTAHDLAQNSSQPLTAEFSVINTGTAGNTGTVGPDLGTVLGPIFRQLEKGIAFLIPKIFQPKRAPVPFPVIVISKNPPMFNWWLKILDWRNILLIVLFILVLFNFYRNRIRRKRTQNNISNIPPS